MPLVKFCGLTLDMSYHTIKHLLKQGGVIDSAYVRRPAFAPDPLTYTQLDRLARMARIRLLDRSEK